MDRGTVFIIIPVYNKIDLTLRCLESLQQQTYQNYEIIVVDDGSVDNSKDKIEQFFPDVRVLSGDGNLWWTGATNLGVNYVLSQAKDHDFILTLNNDLEVNEDYLQSLLDSYEKYKPCLVGSVSVHINDPEKIDFLGKKWNKYLAKTRPVIKTSISYSKILKNYDFLHTDLLTGRGTLIPIQVFKQIGLYDAEHFPQYIADYDFAVRAKKAGYNLIISTRACVKSVVENTGMNYQIRKIKYTDFYKSLFSIKSPIKLEARYYWAMKHSPFKLLYFIIDVLRILISYHKTLFTRIH